MRPTSAARPRRTTSRLCSPQATECQNIRLISFAKTRRERQDRSQVNIPLIIYYLSGGRVNLPTGLPFTVLSDTITRTFTLASNVSVTTLPLPTETLNYKIVSSTEALDTFLQNGTYASYVYNSLNRVTGAVPFDRNNIFTKVAITNVNRATYGGVDEVQCTWGYDFANAGLVLFQTA
jgi:hypothetical protein